MVGDRRDDREALADKTSREDRLKRREELRCSYCPPHADENASRRPKHVPKPKKRNRRP